MARTKLDDTLILSLGAYRQRIVDQIKELQNSATLQDLQTELAAVEAKLQEIDPTIPPVDLAALAVAAPKV